MKEVYKTENSRIGLSSPTAGVQVDLKYRWGGRNPTGIRPPLKKDKPPITQVDRYLRIMEKSANPRPSEMDSQDRHMKPLAQEIYRANERRVPILYALARKRPDLQRLKLTDPRSPLKPKNYADVYSIYDSKYQPKSRKGITYGTVNATDTVGVRSYDPSSEKPEDKSKGRILKGIRRGRVPDSQESLERLVA